jgi:hypothetical protein
MDLVIINILCIKSKYVVLRFVDSFLSNRFTFRILKVLNEFLFSLLLLSVCVPFVEATAGEAGRAARATTFTPPTVSRPPYTPLRRAHVHLHAHFENCS